MLCSPTVRISKYFGAASIQKEEMTLEAAKSALQYFFTEEGGRNVTISVDGQQIKSYEELVAIAQQPKYAKNAYIDLGLYLSNSGKQSIWPKR